MVITMEFPMTELRIKYGSHMGSREVLCPMNLEKMDNLQEAKIHIHSCLTPQNVEILQAMFMALLLTITCFYMRCMKGTSTWADTDQLSVWAVSGSSTSLVPQPGTRDITTRGLGLYYDGERIIAVDTGATTWTSKTMYYREFGTGIAYPTNPAPGTTTWIGEKITSDEDVLAVNVRNHWSARTQGDRVDYWVSADNGTH